MKASSQLGDFGFLTPKQHETLKLLVQGFTSKEIARTLGISPYTVDQRINLIKRKTGIRTRRELGSLYGTYDGIYGQSVYETTGLDVDVLPDQSHITEAAAKFARPNDQHPIFLEWIRARSSGCPIGNEVRWDSGAISMKALRDFIMVIAMAVFLIYNLYTGFMAAAEIIHP